MLEGAHDDAIRPCDGRVATDRARREGTAIRAPADSQRQPAWCGEYRANAGPKARIQ
jgi:hypothetical protein